MGASVLVIGGGGREHALAWKLAQSEHVDKVYVAPGNGGTALLAENVPIGFTDVGKLLEFARQNKIDLTVVGQEAASEAGVVDAFQDAGLLIFGPTIAAALIESSKAFAKDLMSQQQIPTATYRNFTNPDEALEYAYSHKLPVVIKADGLATGKGVLICESYEQAKTAIYDIMVKKVFGGAGAKVVIEDFLTGQEISVHALSDGKNSILFPSSQDHKQIFDGDKGPNTGGMGVIAPVSWVTDNHMETVKNLVVTPVLKGLSNKGTPFNGCLYPGLMINGENIKVVEFNARFGDPEAEVYMRLLDTDLYQIMVDCAKGELDPNKVSWQSGFAACVIIASGGYPGTYKKDVPISGLDPAEKLDDVVVFHAGTTKDDKGYKTAGGRVLAVTAVGDTLDLALAKAYEAVKLIHFEGMQYRTDIGKRN